MRPEHLERLNALKLKHAQCIVDLSRILRARALLEPEDRIAAEQLMRKSVELRKRTLHFKAEMLRLQADIIDADAQELAADEHGKTVSNPFFGTSIPDYMPEEL